MSMQLARPLLLGGLLIGLTATAQAQAPGALAACQQSAQQFCAAMAPGPGQAMCLRDHAAQLTPDCSAALQQVPAAPAMAQAAPMPAPAYAAPAAPAYPAPGAYAAPGAGYAVPGAGYPAPAPGGAYAPAAGGYGAAQPAQRAAMMEVFQACRPDLQTVCAGIHPGGGRLAQCLRVNFRTLTPACRQTLLSVRAARQGGGGAYQPGGYSPQQ